MIKRVLLIIALFSTLCLKAQNDTLLLSLNDAIVIACDSSLDAFIAENTFLKEYWIYKNYKAGKLPFLDLNTTPVDFERSVEKEYNFIDSNYYYIDNQSVTSYLNLSLNQNITKTGGKVYVDSDVSRLQNLSGNTPVQYSSTLIRVGVEQQLFGYNPYKWDDKIQPLMFEKSKLDYISSTIDISLQTINIYFSVLIRKQQKYIAEQNMKISESLLHTGKERYKIGSVNNEDIYTLEIDYLNAKNRYLESTGNYKKSIADFKSFLRLSNEQNIELYFPDSLIDIKVLAHEAINKAFALNPDLKAIELKLLNASKETDHAKKNKRFNANINASFGLNQTGISYNQSIENPRDYEAVKLTVKVPIVDWGMAKAAYKIAEQNEEVTRISCTQNKVNLENEIINTVDLFNYQFEYVSNAKNVLDIALKSYDLVVQKYRHGKIDLTMLKMSNDYWVNAQYSYLSSLQTYWELFFKIRKYTLYDFVETKSLSDSFDENFLQIE